MKCPKCGCELDGPGIGRHTKKWFVKHIVLSRCPYEGKHWGFHDTEQLAIEAVERDESPWQPLSQDTLAFVNRLVDVERDKLRREKLKGSMAG